MPAEYECHVERRVLSLRLGVRCKATRGTFAPCPQGIDCIGRRSDCLRRAGTVSATSPHVHTFLTLFVGRVDDSQLPTACPRGRGPSFHNVT